MSEFTPTAIDDCVGTISEVNEHMGREGLLRCPPIQPLISEEVLKPITPEAVRKLRESKIEVYYCYTVYSLTHAQVHIYLVVLSVANGC